MPCRSESYVASRTLPSVESIRVNDRSSETSASPEERAKLGRSEANLCFDYLLLPFPVDRCVATNDQNPTTRDCTFCVYLRQSTQFDLLAHRRRRYPLDTQHPTKTRTRSPFLPLLAPATRLAWTTPVPEPARTRARIARAPAP